MKSCKSLTEVPIWAFEILPVLDIETFCLIAVRAVEELLKVADSHTEENLDWDRVKALTGWWSLKEFLQRYKMAGDDEFSFVLKLPPHPHPLNKPT